MGNLIRKTVNLFKVKKGLGRSVNRSRIFNTWEMVGEVGGIIFYNMGPTLTNQKRLIEGHNVTSSFMLITNLLIH